MFYPVILDEFGRVAVVPEGEFCVKNDGDSFIESLDSRDVEGSANL